MPSATAEEYLEAIYKLSLIGEVRPAHLADALAVSAPTVTATLRRLLAAGLVERPAGGVALTEDGRREALAIVRRHRIAERFLVDVLDLPWEAAHDEACRLEHALSERVLSALEGYLDNPLVCPHGHPIPSNDLDVASEEGVPLSSLGPGDTSTVVCVPEEDEEMLAYMARMTMLPGNDVTVEEIAPFEGPMLVVVSGSRFPVDRAIARRILVRPEE